MVTINVYKCHWAIFFQLFCNSEHFAKELNKINARKKDVYWHWKKDEYSKNQNKTKQRKKSESREVNTQKNSVKQFCKARDWCRPKPLCARPLEWPSEATGLVTTESRQRLHKHAHTDYIKQSCTSTFPLYHEGNRERVNNIISHELLRFSIPIKLRNLDLQPQQGNYCHENHCQWPSGMKE